MGEILTVTIRNAGEGSYICWLDNTPYPLYRIEKDTLRTFIGFGTSINPKTCKLWVKKGSFTPQSLVKAKNKILAQALLTETKEELWRGDFIWPVKGRITGEYGERRIYKKITGGNSLSWRGIHSGIDIRQQRGAPVSSSNSGRVIIARRFSGEGNAILIDHGQGVLTFYCHLDRIDVKEGDFVQKGEIIGKVGSTGLSTAPHLHFGLYIHGTPVNPLFWVK
ncbi:MAG: M23 family metallopeptidase [bacterium]